MKKWICLFALLFSSFSWGMAMGDVEGHFFLNGTEELTLDPNAPAILEVYFTDKKTGKVLKEFKIMHGKLMHMVLVKKDLSEFRHIHPYFDRVTGRFQVTLNLNHNDPDNFDNFLSEPGQYMVMADVEIKDKGMRMDHAWLTISGNIADQALTADPMKNGIATKEFMTHEGLIRGNFSFESTAGCGSSLVDLKLYLEKWDGKKWIPLDSLENWLSMGSHAIWMSEKFMGHHHKMSFAHMHAKLPWTRNGDDEQEPILNDWDSTLYFNFHDKKIMKNGLQKLWIQVKYKGKIYTLPYIFKYEQLINNQSC